MRKFFSTILISTIIASTSLLATGLVTPAFGMDGHDIEINAQTDGISVVFAAQGEREVLTFSVRVVGPEQIVYEERIKGTNLQWIPPGDLPDGMYQWEAWVVTADPAAPGQKPTSTPRKRTIEPWIEGKNTQTHLTSGTFRVEHGLLESIPSPVSEGAVTSGVRRVARAVMDFIMPSAMAFGDFDDFVRIQNPSGTGVSDLRLQGNDQSFSWTNWWRVVNNGEANNRFEIREGQLTTRLAIAQGGNTGIGTESPLRRLHIVVPGSNNAALYIQNDDGHWRVGPGLPDAAFNIWGNDSIMRMRILQSAPASSLVITSTGSGFGTSAPGFPLHVVRANNTARVLVEDTGTTDVADIMFELRNEGNPQFRMRNTATDRVWNFRTQDFDECSTANTCFVINKRNGPRFRFMQDGDMFIEGAYENSSSRTVKSSINALDSNDLFERLERVDVYEWSYDHSPDSRHVGPMAEDFYAAFGLGSGEKSISPSNLAGVSLAAAKVLQDRVQATELENAELRARIEILEAIISN